MLWPILNTNEGSIFPKTSKHRKLHRSFSVAKDASVPFAVHIKKDKYNYVDPETETVTVYDFEHDKEPARHTFSERIKAGIFEELWLDFSGMDLE